MAGSTVTVSSSKVACANSITSEVAPFFNIEVAVDKRLEIASGLSRFAFKVGLMLCSRDVSSLQVAAEVSSGAARSGAARRNMI
jgi:hypothetical protein